LHPSGLYTYVYTILVIQYYHIILTYKAVYNRIIYLSINFEQT